MAAHKTTIYVYDFILYPGNRFASVFLLQSACLAAASRGRHVAFWYHRHGPCGKTCSLPLVPSELTAVGSKTLAQFSRNKRTRQHASPERDHLDMRCDIMTTCLIPH